MHRFNLFTSKEIQITRNGSTSNPAIYGDNIVWIDYRNGKAEIYMYNLSTSEETQITSSKSDKSDPDIYGDRIVWEHERNGNPDIYMYNLSTRKETQITTSGSTSNPVIYGNRIVWVDGRNGNSDIYMCIISKKESGSKTPVADFFANITSGNAPLKVLFTDNSTGTSTSWFWDFGDGINSKYVMNATHTFTKPGIYNVTLNVTNAAGSNSISRRGYITVKSE